MARITHSRKVHGSLGMRRRREIRHAIIDVHREHFSPVITKGDRDALDHRKNKTKTLAILIAAATIGVPVILIWLYLTGI